MAYGFHSRQISTRSRSERRMTAKAESTRDAVATPMEERIRDIAAVVVAIAEICVAYIA